MLANVNGTIAIKKPYPCLDTFLLQYKIASKPFVTKDVCTEAVGKSRATDHLPAPLL
jgi:hypothetical protein